MKIVHIITRLIIGGAQENTLISCEGQHADGHEVILITGPAIGPEGSLLARANAGGYRVIVLDEMRRAIRPFADYAIYRKLRKLIVELRPDIVHTHSSKAGIIGRKAAFEAREDIGRIDPTANRLAIIHTIHGLAFTASTSPAVNRVYRFLERRCALMSDKIVCVADSMRDQSLAAKIGEPEQYVTVYSGMETAPFLSPSVPRAQVRKTLGLSENDIAIGTIARLFDLKGHEDLLAIAPSLCRKFPNLRFLWVGDGTRRGEYEKQMETIGLRDRFILTGMVPPARVPELAGAMDILVHPSRREGLARALPQAALAQLPAITYDIDGAKEAVADGVTGFVIEPFNLDKLSDAIAVLMEDAERRIAMGTAGRAFALAKFDARVMVNAMQRVYEQAISEIAPIVDAARKNKDTK